MRVWQVYPENLTLCEKLSVLLERHPVVAQTLLNRQIRSLSEARLFLEPRGSQGQFDHGDLDRIYQLVVAVASKKQKVLVYGDYDVDGVTSTTMMVRFLQHLGIRVVYEIPHRMKDGYGVNASIVSRVQHHGVSLLITLDCGISNTEEIAALKEKTGAQVVVMDHHKIPENVPPADVILNPKVFDETHALYHLATAGIVYKFIEYVALSYPDHGIEAESYLDLACLGTIADVASLVGENRRIASEGLTVLSRRKRIGLRCLLDVAKLDKPVLTARDVGFVIAPRINASGRLSHAGHAVEMLLSDDEERAILLARRLEGLNDDRRALCETTQVDVSQAVESDSGALAHPILVHASSGWHPGVIGITASRLVEAYQRPAVLIAIVDGIGRGSARTCGQVNLYEVLRQFSSFFLTFGGHREAAGFSIAVDQIDPFMTALRDRSQSLIREEDLFATLDIDCVVQPQDLTLEIAREIQYLAPFGQGNKMPVFYTNQLKPLSFKTVGATDKHLKVTFSDPTGKVVIDAIGFNLGDQLETLYRDSLELAFHLDVNDWNGRCLPQLQLIDIR